MTIGQSPKLDGRAVVGRRDDVVVEELDDEAVLWDPRTMRLHILNAPATVVWACLDGTISIHELAAELADAFGVGTERMEADVLGIIHHLDELGLVAGSAAVANPLAEADGPQPDVQRVGPVPHPAPAGEQRFLPAPPDN